jgi:hypothetical protein
VGPGISCGARKLARTPRVTKKKKLYPKISNFGTRMIYLLGMKIKLTVVGLLEHSKYFFFFQFYPPNISLLHKFVSFPCSGYMSPEYAMKG